MKFAKLISTWLVMLGVSAGSLFGGSFEGVVETDTAAPLENVVVILTDAAGQTQQTTTLADGSYAFADLAAGWYTVHILIPPGYVLFEPACGYHYKYVKTKGKTRGNFGLKSGSSGVVIEFGKPPGGRSPGGNKSLHHDSGYFDISIYLANMLGLTPPYPKTITMRGTWLVPGYGPVLVQGIAGRGAGAYTASDLQVGYRNLNENRMEITLTRESWPHFSLDGEAASLELFMPNYAAFIQESPTQIIFCIESIILQNGDVITVAYFWPFVAYFQ